MQRLSYRVVAVAVVCLLLACRSAARATQSGTAAIFMYHHVANIVAPGPYARALTVTPAEFGGHLAWLLHHGCAVVSVDVLERDVQTGTVRACEAALTFDDGYADAEQLALPLLQRYHDLATFYIATGLVGAPGHLTRAQLQHLASSGMQIGAHTVHHVDLTTVSHGQMAREIDDSKAALTRRFGNGITTFAYPAGQYNSDVEQVVRAAGFSTAVTTQPGTVMQGHDAYALPRYRILRGEGEQLLQEVFSHSHGGPSVAPLVLQHIAHARIEGNDPVVAEDIAVALLAARFPEPILKVHALVIPSARVAGIVLSGVKFHAPRSREAFADDVRRMVVLAFDAVPNLNEVDVWATVPLAAPAGKPVSGDYAVPTSRTVFSAAITRDQVDASGVRNLGKLFWDPHFLR